MGLPHKDGKPVLYPRLVLGGQISPERIAEELTNGTIFHADDDPLSPFGTSQP